MRFKFDKIKSEHLKKNPEEGLDSKMFKKYSNNRIMRIIEPAIRTSSGQSDGLKADSIRSSMKFGRMKKENFITW